MIDATRTTTMLLEGLFDTDDRLAWSEFDARYRPILLAFARRLGMNDSDASDVAQETLLQFVKEYRSGRYDRRRGRLRSWLIGIARYRVASLRRTGARQPAFPAGSAILNLPDQAELTTVWESERRAIVLQEALNELRARTRLTEQTLQAFEMLVIRQMPVVAIAEELDISAHDVYLAKSRVASRLREIIERLERAFDEEVP
ncbi:MAG: RNA polymerase sigma factor [Planctomycetes bacterium]|nr:RNA polymerase sigma factor [Planctomycetota bacterium]